MSTIIYSPKEQFINFPVLSFNFLITNSSFYLFLAAFFLVGFNLFIHFSSNSTNNNYLINNNWQLFSESLYNTALNKISSFINKNFTVYFPLIYTIFFVILFSNFLGLIPYSSTATVEIVLTLSLAFTLLFGILLIGFLNHQLLLLATFLPAGTPLLLIPLMVFLEIVAYIFRTISLGLRLAINLITGHVLAKVGVSFIWLGFTHGTHFLILLIPILLVTLYLALEILIAYLQSYIFIFITCLTFNDLA